MKEKIPTACTQFIENKLILHYAKKCPICYSCLSTVQLCSYLTSLPFLLNPYLKRLFLIAWFIEQPFFIKVMEISFAQYCTNCTLLHPATSRHFLISVHLSVRTSVQRLYGLQPEQISLILSTFKGSQVQTQADCISTFSRHVGLVPFPHVKSQLAHYHAVVYYISGLR